jgi:hypothetical protein
MGEPRGKCVLSGGWCTLEDPSQLTHWDGLDPIF